MKKNNKKIAVIMMLILCLTTLLTSCFKTTLIDDCEDTAVFKSVNRKDNLTKLILLTREDDFNSAIKLGFDTSKCSTYLKAYDYTVNNDDKFGKCISYNNINYILLFSGSFDINEKTLICGDVIIENNNEILISIKCNNIPLTPYSETYMCGSFLTRKGNLKLIINPEFGYYKK